MSPWRDEPEMVRLRRVLVRFVVGLALFILAASVAVWWMGYQGRWDVVHAQRAGCERGKLDRRANARGWREALRARRATAADRGVPRSERHSARKAAKTYAGIVRELDARGRVDCSVAFPAPAVFGFH